MDGSRAERCFILAAALLLAAALAGGCATESTGFLLHPQPPTAKEYTLSAGALVYNDGKVEVEVRPLDPKLVKERLAGEGRADPFLVPEGAPALLIFEVRIKNVGKRPIYFNPAQARGLDDDKNRYYPLGFSDFFQLYSEDPQGEARLKSFSALCFDSALELPAGREVTRYLPITGAEEAPKSLVISIPLMHDGKEGLYPSFLFEGFPIEKPPKS